MQILTIDTATTEAVLGWAEDERVLAEVSVPIQGKNGETLLLHLDAMLGSAGATIEQVDLIVVGLGPGSFTGLRVAVATAKSFAFGLKKPVVGIGTLDALAQTVLTSDGELCAAVIDAHKERIYGALYAHSDGRLVTLLEPADLTAQAFCELLAARLGPDGRLHVAGNAIVKFGEVFSSSLGPRATLLPSASVSARALCELGLRKFREHGGDEPLSLLPLYVRPSDAILPTPTRAG